MTFIPVSKVLSGFDDESLSRAARIAIKFGYIPTYNISGELSIHQSDLVSVPVRWERSQPLGELALGGAASVDFGQDCWSRVTLANDVELLLPPIRSIGNAFALFAAARSLARSEHMSVGDSGELAEVSWPHGVIAFVRVNSEAHRLAWAIARRMQRLLADRAADFTKSAYYMGSKQALAPFLVEVAANFVTSDGVIIDLMCGSGSASRAFSHEWGVIACDAMAFCTDLAGCWSRSDAINSFRRDMSDFQTAFSENVRELSALASSLLVAEEQFLYSADSFEDGISSRYADFCDGTPRVPQDLGIGDWFANKEAELRRANPARFPFCLTLAYFGNLYFGVRQAIELDSVRYAISRVRHPEIAVILRAALISTASYISTGYASQFAQPVSIRSISKREYSRMIEKRSLPVFSEFIARAMAIGAHAEFAENRIETRTGSWQECLKSLSGESFHGKKFAYVDAPYTRDEYARYYHVLESLVRYSYPVTHGRSNVPMRGTPEMFRSEFFTRTASSIPRIFVDVIRSCLEQCELCFWSYSSGARGSIQEVVERLRECNIEVIGSFSAGHAYQAQGGKGRVKTAVVEYVMIFKKCVS